MLNPFFNDRERRLRAFWRLLLQSIISSVLWYAASASFALVGRAAFGAGAVEDPLASPFFLATGGVVTLVVALFVVWLAGRFFDRRPFSGFGFRI
ncbi:MAG: hypothetical protein M3272_07300, partial [Actinomycetota bacterium]|nr:hypothetical protein [Actinomycetota bacterium]